jgi:serine protease
MPTRLLTLVTFSLLAACGGGSSGDGAGTSRSTAQVPNQMPVAVAQASGPVREGSLVTLDGSASADGDGAIHRYAWSQLSGAPVTLNAADAAVAWFTAPDVTGDSTLVFRLVVSDDVGASDRDDVHVIVRPARFSLSGTITAAPGTAVDGDVNDPDAPRTPNDTASEAQEVPNPVILGGYLNAPGAGPRGPLYRTGDTSDFYRLHLHQGQSVSLFVADPEAGDLDLYLWQASGAGVIDASMDAAALESLVAPDAGEYLVEVTSFSGASNYTLVAGQIRIPGIHSGVRLSDDFVPGEVILEPRGSTAAPHGTAAWQRGAGAGAAAPGPPVLARLEHLAGAMSGSRASRDFAIWRSLPREVERPFADAQASDKHATLLAMKALRRDYAIANAQLNYRIRPRSVPNDPFYPLQWHYPMIELPAAWDFTTGDPGVTVAVIDTGILAQHPDLAGQLLPGYDFVSNPASSGDGDGIDPDPEDPGDGNGVAASSFHGTHVAGTVAAASGNGIGAAGVAPGVKLLPLRALGPSGGSSYDILQAVRYAAGLTNDSGTVRAPVDVINLSLGRRGPCWPAEQAAFDAARQAGVVVVAAAGNDDEDAADAFPANCSNVVAVGAVDLHGNRAPYSNYGSAVDVQAPGGRATDANGDGYPDGVLSLMGDEEAEPMYTYAFRKGTSMASPHVAGVVALMKSVNPNLTPEEIDQMLAVGELTRGDGLISAYRAVIAALDAAGSPPAVEPRLSVSPASLNFGAVYNHAEIDLQVAGGDGMSVDAPSAGSTWLRVTPTNVTSDNLGRYAVTVDRAGLAPGAYADIVSITSAGNTLEIPVIMQVAESRITADAGHLFVLLLDPATGDVVEQAEVSAANGSYAFEFAAVTDGRYLLIAGTDTDNDLAVCDAGEGCGGYPTLLQPTTVVVEADASGLDFTVGRVISVGHRTAPTGPETSRSAGTSIPRGS